MHLNEAVLRWFVDLSDQGILVTDADLNIRAWNQWLETHSGQSAAEMIGRNLLAVYPELATRRLDDYFTDALEGQVRVLSQRLHGYLLPMKAEIDNRGFNRMQQSARIAPLLEEDRVIGTITVITDVTERVAREDALVRALTNEKSVRAAAEAANRAKDEFLATVSHELRTPLNAISGWVQILRTGKVDDDSSAHALEAIERSAKAQAKLIEDILDASRIITGKLRLDVRPVDLSSIVETAVDTVRPTADAKTIKVETVINSAGLVSGDPNRLQQVIWNLLFNAIKFTPTSGRVTIQLDSDNDEVVVSVKDTGQGISAEFLPHVFDRFRQADNTTARRHGGLGLGLAIVRNLVESHGGTVQAQSEGEGRGATFSVRLPVVNVHKAKELPSQERVHVAELHDTVALSSTALLPLLAGVRVLVVDDESDAREMLEIALSQRGATVTTAKTAREALELMQKWRPDVLVSDIGMPVEDGYLLISKVRALPADRGGRVPAVALTGYASPEDRLRLLSAGYHLHLSKPVELGELTVLIARLARRKATSQSNTTHS
jgi:PAS domain S-box-containing protein